MAATLTLAFDLLLALLLIWAAVETGAGERLRAIVMFIVFGLLVSLAWLRLGAPDLAMAEAAVGAGLTGVLLLDALGRMRRHSPRRDAEDDNG